MIFRNDKGKKVRISNALKCTLSFHQSLHDERTKQLEESLKISRELNRLLAELIDVIKTK